MIIGLVIGLPFLALAADRSMDGWRGLGWVGRRREGLCTGVECEGAADGYAVRGKWGGGGGRVEGFLSNRLSFIRCGGEGGQNAAGRFVNRCRRERESAVGLGE